MKNPLINRDTPRWSDNDIARLNRARGIKKAKQTRKLRYYEKKRWQEVDGPGRQRVAVLLSYLLAKHGPIDVSFNPTKDVGRRLKRGAQYGKLIAVKDGWLFTVLIEGYKRPQNFHPAFWEPLLD